MSPHFPRYLFTLILAAPLSGQSTGMGVVLKDPTPREPDPRTILKDAPKDPAEAKRLQAAHSQRQKQLLTECNQILILAHQLHLKVLDPATQPALPPDSILAGKIAELARKVQKDVQTQ